MTLDQWLHTGRRFDFQGHRIFYKDEGTGPVLLCIHGFPTSSWDWHRIWSDLTRRFRVIAADMIGFGFSDKPRAYTYSLFDQADLYEALLDYLGIDSFYILAHDYGDTVVQELLARQIEDGAHPLDIQSVCLLNGGIFPELIQPLLIQSLLRGPLGGITAALMNPMLFRRNFSRVFGPHTQPTRDELDAFWSIITYNGGKKVVHKVGRYLNERFEHRERWVGALQHTDISLRFIYGPADPVSGALMAERFRDLIPGSDVIMLGEHIGHYPQLEDPPGVLKAFLV